MENGMAYRMTGTPMSRRDISRPRPEPDEMSLQLFALARRVNQLSVSHRDPESFFVEKSCISRELREIARRTNG